MKGFILKSIAGCFHVLCHEDKQIYICKARGQIRNNKLTPVCGDEVDFSYDTQANFSLINEIMPRKNILVRPPIANVDMALIVMSTAKPQFDSYLVDKLIVCTSLEQIEPVIVVSKNEFITEEIQSLINNYKTAGYKVIQISAHLKQNMEQITEQIKDKRVVLCGQSAVGKSSLINALCDNTNRNIGDYSEKLGRGKHQTREVEFLNINGGYIADTPGFSSLTLKVELPIFARLFKDFSTLANSCRFSSCLHKDEPGCAIKKAVEENIIDKRRYNNYIHLMNEIKDGKHVWRKK